jgi:hypothetical protein
MTDNKILNPNTNRRIKIGSVAHIKLMEAGTLPALNTGATAPVLKDTGAVAPVSTEPVRPAPPELKSSTEVQVCENGLQKMKATLDSMDSGITITVGEYQIKIKKKT